MLRNFFPIFVFFLLLFASSHTLRAQELDCDVQVNFEPISTTNKEFLVNFANEVKEYLNNFRWTNEDFQGEKIKCSFNIFFQSASGNQYRAQIFIGSQRPIYQSDRSTPASTPVVRILDDQWDFVYEKNQRLYHNEFRFDPLASLLDFYVYVIIGFDFDTMEPLSGTSYFQRASSILYQAQSSSFSRGWVKATGIYTRAELIEQLLSSRYEPLRQLIYQYHFNGLDLLSSDRYRALSTIADVVNQFADFKRKEATNLLFIRTFFDAKYLELADVFTRYSDKSIYDKLNDVDPSHQKTYDEYKTKSM